MQAQSKEPKWAVERLKSAEVYAFGGVGFAGTTSRGELDFHVITAMPPDRALAAFEDLYAHGNNQAKSYALAGFHRLSPARFKELSGVASNSDIRVETMHGRTQDSQKLSDVAKEINLYRTDGSWLARY